MSGEKEAVKERLNLKHDGDPLRPAFGPEFDLLTPDFTLPQVVVKDMAIN